MKIIKLDSIDSTNTFLKELSSSTNLENFTVVTTKRQTLGRGQMDAKWISEDYKNLTFSILLKFDNLKIDKQIYLNFAISLGVFDFLNELNLPKITIKWPNDILCEKQKICGILIENSLQKNNIKSAVVGVGLNVNQQKFPNTINATSVYQKTQKEFNLDELLGKLLNKLSFYTDLVYQKKYNFLKKSYLENLYLKNIPSMFKSDELFMGKIIDVDNSGKLVIERENEIIQKFSIKEIKFIR